MVEIGALEKALIDKKILVAPCFSSVLRFQNVALNPNDISVFFNRDEFIVEISTQQIDDPFAQNSRLQIVNVCTVVEQRQMQVGMSKRNPFEFFQNMAEFRAVFFKKIPACGNIKEEVLDLEGCPNWTGESFLQLDIAPFNYNVLPDIIVLSAGMHFNMRNSSDRGKGFTAKPFGVK